MADEIVLSGMSSDVAAAAAAEYLLYLAERGSLAMLPQLHYAGSVDLRRSNVISVPLEGLGGYDTPSTTTAEAADTANQAYSDNHADITVGKYTKVYSLGDMARITMGDIINPTALALDAAAVGANVATNLICTVGSTFTATSSPGTGLDADIPSLLAAIGKVGTLNCDTSRGFAGVLHGQQWSDVTVDYATAGVAIPFTDNAPTVLPELRPGHKGLWLGVDWWHNNRVPAVNSGADRGGCIFAYGGIIWGDASALVEDANQYAIGRNVLFERQRQARGGRTEWVTHVQIGASKGVEAGLMYFSDL